jgi:DNA (cytosine-5)-methyltransferase 1
MDRSLPTALGLCAGVGMLELGVDIALGGSRAVGYVERDSFAAAILLERMEDEALEPAPVFAGDLARFPWADFRGLVDVVTGGFPCQPHSVAGSRAGVSDERWIWPDIMAGIRILGPRIVVLENVSGIRSSGGLAPVLGDMASSGFRVAWTSLRASDVGASHQRERVFIVGVDDARGAEWGAQRLRGGGARQGLHGGREEDGGSRLSGAALADSGREREQRRRDAGELRGSAAEEHREGLQRQRHGHAAGDGGTDVADGDGRRFGEHGRGELLDGLRPARGHDPDGCDPDLGDAGGSRSQGLAEGTHAPGREVSSGPTGPAGRELFAPGPTDPRWPSIIAERPDLAPAVEPGLRVLVDGLAYVVDESRADRLRAIGNGVVALQAAVAVRHLLRELGFLTLE